MERLVDRAARLPGSVVDAALAAGLAVAITVRILVAHEPQAAPQDAFAYGLGIAIAALALFRRRAPLVVLVATALLLQTYYSLDYPGISPALPLSVALATATAAGHVRWALAIAVWFVVAPLVYRLAIDPQPVMQVIGDEVNDAVLLGAVLLLGDAIRSRRALDREHSLLRAERERSEQLLLSILPASVAARLKRSREPIAETLPEATVLFADIVGFTRLSAHLPAIEVVSTLDELFGAFDELAAARGLDKIKTIGDAYMIAAGVPDPRPDHAEAAADMALAMLDEVARRPSPDGRPLRLRIGIDTGPVVAGVIGRDRFAYDVWGDTVNTASRMESSGVPGRIQVTARTYERLRDRYVLEPRGTVGVKGKGEMSTYFLLGRADGDGRGTATEGRAVDPSPAGG
jgi:class 3 adenylate cyclase